MKNLQPIKIFFYFLLLVTSFAYAQPPINQPNDLSACDINGDGFEIFDLTVNNSLILGSLNPNLYEISFHQTNEDAIDDLNPISQPNSYQSSGVGGGVFVRVEEIADTTNFGIANFNLFVNPLPVIDLNDLTTCSNSNDSLICNVTPNGNYIYTWSLNGNVISGASLNTYYPTTSGLYEVNVLNSITGCSASDSAQVIVNTTPTATISGGGNYFVNSNSASFVISIQNGVSPYTINYIADNISMQMTTSENIIGSFITTNSVATYTIILTSVIDGNGCIANVNGTEIFNIIPNINTPATFHKCKENNDGFSDFDLQSKNNEILGNLNQNYFTVSYYINNLDAMNGVNQISSQSLFQNTEPFSQVIYVRVQQNTNTANYSITTLTLKVNSLPYIITPTNFVVSDNPLDNIPSPGLTRVNLTLKDVEILGSLNPTEYLVKYYHSISDAENDNNFIANAIMYENFSTFETIVVRVTSISTGCYSITNFNLIISNITISPISDYPICDDDHDGFSSFNLQSKNSQVLGSLSPSLYTVSYHASMSDANNDLNSLLSPYTNTSQGSQLLFCRVEENANPANYTTNDFVIVSAFLSVPAISQTLKVYENPYDGEAIFDLASNYQYITSGTIGFQINYYLTELDAQNHTNAIIDPTTFIGTNLQTIWYNGVLGYSFCYSYNIGSFQLKVFDSSLLVYAPSIKYKLIQQGVDTNNDEEIQITEALAVTSLDFSNYNNSDFTGIEAFINLTHLDLSNNYIYDLNLTNLTSLVELNCNYNYLTTLQLNQTTLQKLTFDGNALTEFDATLLTNLKHLSCSENLLTSLNVNGLSNLEFLYCKINLLSSLNSNSLSSLKELDCSGNLISSLDLSNSTLLTHLSSYSNQLTSLNLSSNNQLIYLDCNYNQLTNLNFNSNQLIFLDCTSNQLTSLEMNSCPLLTNLKCDMNQLNNLDVSGLTNLINLNCNNNLLTEINVSGLTNLEVMSCYSNQLTSLDLSELINLDEIYCDNNQLTLLILKNGSNESFLSLFPNPIQFVCVDESELETVQNLIYPYIPDCVINTYCSFTPGGNHNTITGNIKLDANNNGCDTNDLLQANIRVNISDGANTVASFTNIMGDYKFYTQAGSFDLTPEVENTSFFNFSPTTATIPFTDNNNNTATQDFCFSANGVHSDLEVVLAPITPARPGFDAVYQLIYKNKGNQTLNGVLSLNYDVFRLLFISSNTTPDFNFEGTIDWNFTNLLPFESRSISLTLNVNSPLETPAVNIGDVLNFVATINPISGDELPDDNTFALAQTVVGSYDPNDITCLEGNNVAPSEIGEYLHYAINFENTGNYPAENVVVKTIVDTTKFDIDSLQLLNTSNPVDARITGNVVEFIFENIQLGGPGGHGHILLKIKSKNTLISGDAVAKNANIYFDYNAPVDTGMATTVFQSLSNTVFEKDDSINVSPNPTNGNINININFNIKKVELYDVQGRVLETQIGETKSFDISEKANGIYFLKITTEKGSKVEKVIKE